MESNKESWEVEFDKRFDLHGWPMVDLKKFIQETINQAIATERKRLEEVLSLERSVVRREEFQDGRTYTRRLDYIQGRNDTIDLLVSLIHPKE